MICANCGEKINTADKFCRACGQKQPLADLSFRSLVSDLWLVMTNLDNSFFRTLKEIGLPWRLTSHYVNGHRKKYINPFRLFIILLLVYVGLIVSQVNFDNIDFFNRFTDYKSIKKIHSGIKEVQKEFPNNAELFSDIDSIFIKNEFLVEQDTLFQLTLSGKPYVLFAEDVLNKDIEAVYKKNNITKFHEKVVYKQTIKALKDPIGAIKFIFGNLTWTIILSSIILAFFFKLFYFRQNKKFIEHLILICNIHSLSFLINSLLIIVSINLSSLSDYWLILLWLPPLIFGLSIKMYYKNGFLLTLLKIFLSSMIYLLAFSLFISLVSLISFVIF